MLPQKSQWLRNRGSAQYLGMVLKIATMFSATLVLFSGDLLVIFSDALRDESASHVLSIPVIVAYLVFRKRRVIQAASSFNNGRGLFSRVRVDAVAGGLLLLVSMGFYWHGSYTMMSLEYHVLAMILFLASCILILFNSSVLRQLIFPLLLLSLLFPPAEIMYNAGSALSVVSSTITYSVLKTVGYPVSLNNEYQNPWLQVVRQDGTSVIFSVDPACSGIYSLMGFLVFALFIAYLVRGSAWKKAVAFSVGFPLIYSLNIARLVATMLVGYYFGEATALNLFHLFGGWVLVFLGTILLLVSFRRVFGFNLASKPFGECKTCEKADSPVNSGFCFNCSRLLASPVASFDRTDLARILAVSVSVILITAIQMPIFLTKGQTELVVNTPSGQTFSTEILPQIDNYSLAYVTRDMEFERYAKQDLSLIYSYVPDNSSEDTIWVSLELASIRSSLHRTEACLIKWYAAGEKVEELVSRDHQLLENPPVLGRYCVFHFTKSETNQTVIYWIQTSLFSINSTIVEKYVKISLAAYPTSLSHISDFETRLVGLAKSVAVYWEPINQWSQVALVLSKSRYFLVSLPSLLLVGTVLYALFQRLRDKKADAQAYQKLPQPHKKVVDAVSQTQISNVPAFDSILSTYRKITGQPINGQEFHNMLLAVEKTEVVKGGFVSIDDYPFKVWKTRVSGSPMRFQIPSVSRALVILPLSAVGLVAALAVFYLRLDTIIHSELYRFGLQFSFEWAENYWANSTLILGSLAVAAIVNFASAAYMLVSYRARTAPKRSAVALLLLIGVCTAVTSVAFFTRLEAIVHGDLYQFDLRFSEEWAIPYWVNARLFLGLTGLLVIVDCASLIFTVKTMSIVKIAREKLITSLLLLTGGTFLLLALTYESSVSAFAGLSFILWGLVMLYAGSKKYVEESILTTLIFSSLANLDRLLEDLDCKGQALFLPPEFLNDFESCRAYVSVEKSSSPPKPEDIRGKENRVLLKELPGLVIEPPGAELTMLLEERLGTRFTRVDLQFLQRELPKVFVEKLQLAKNLEIALGESKARVTIDDLALMGMYEKICSLTHVYSQIGSPVASAIGCALAKSSGRLVSVEKEVMGQGGRNLTIEYRILRSQEEEK